MEELFAVEGLEGLAFGGRLARKALVVFLGGNLVEVFGCEETRQEGCEKGRLTLLQ